MKALRARVGGELHWLVTKECRSGGQAEAEAFCVRFPIAGKRANTQIRVDISWDLLQMPRVGMH